MDLSRMNIPDMDVPFQRDGSFRRFQNSREEMDLSRMNIPDMDVPLPGRWFIPKIPDFLSF